MTKIEKMILENQNMTLGLLGVYITELATRNYASKGLIEKYHKILDDLYGRSKAIEDLSEGESNNV